MNFFPNRLSSPRLPVFMLLLCCIKTDNGFNGIKLAIGLYVTQLELHLVFNGIIDYFQGTLLGRLNSVRD